MSNTKIQFYRSESTFDVEFNKNKPNEDVTNKTQIDDLIKKGEGEFIEEYDSDNFNYLGEYNGKVFNKIREQGEVFNKQNIFTFKGFFAERNQNDEITSIYDKYPKNDTKFHKCIKIDEKDLRTGDFVVYRIFSKSEIEEGKKKHVYANQYITYKVTELNTTGYFQPKPTGTFTIMSGNKKYTYDPTIKRLHEQIFLKKGGKTKRNKHARKSKTSRKHRRSRKHSKKHTK